MENRYYLKKYNFEDRNLPTDSFLVDLAIEVITAIELKNKFDTPIEDFVKIRKEIETFYFSFKLERTLFNVFVTKFLNHIESLLYEGTENKYENDETGGDFFLFFIDEWNAFKKRAYVHEETSFDVIDCDERTDNAITDAFADMLDQSPEDKYALTIAKNRCLYMVNNDRKAAPMETAPAETINIDKPKKETPAKPEPQKPKEPKNPPPPPATVEFKTDERVIKIKDLLLDNLEKLKDNKLSPEQAQAINSTVQTFINLSKQELETMKFAKTLNK